MAGNDSFPCDPVTGPCGDGELATRVSLYPLFGVAVGPDGSLYSSEFGGAGRGRLRRITPDGVLHTFAGNGTTSCGDPLCGDGGPATQAIVDAWGMALARDGAVYVADLQHQVIRRIDARGIITTVAGTPGNLAGCSSSTGTCGDGGPALKGQLDGPASVAIAPDGSLYIVELRGHRVRHVLPSLPGFSASDIAVASQDGRQVFQFDANGRHLATLNALTGTARSRFQYDSVGRLTSVTDGDANVTRIERTADGSPSTIVTPFAQRTALFLDASGYLASLTNPRGDAVQLSYSVGGLLQRQTDPRGNASSYAYDSLGRLIRDDDAAGGFTSLVRADSDGGHTVAITTALGRTTAYTAEAFASGATRSTVLRPDSVVVTSTISADGATTTTTADGTVTQSELAPEPRFGMQAPVLHTMTVQLPSGLRSTTTALRKDSLSDPGNPLSLVFRTDSVSVNGNTTVSTYSTATRRMLETSPEGRQIESALDANGRVVAGRVGDLDSVTFAYDVRGRLAQRRSGGRVTSYAYSPSSGRLASITDPLGRVTEFSYDSAGRVTTQTLPDGRAIQFGYDANGNLTSLTPPGRPTHGFQYTAVNLTQQYDPPGVPGSTPTRYFYNRDRQLDSIVRPDSVAIAFGYDIAGRPNTVRFDRGTITYGYSDTTGNLTAIRAPTGDSLVFSYDGPLASAVRWMGTVNGSVAVGHNSDLRVVSQTVNGAHQVDFSYDRDGLLTTAGALTLSHNATNGLLAADALGSVAGNYRYTARGELAGSGVAVNGTTLYATGYQRDSLGRITQLDDTTQGTPTQWRFVYDSVGRLAADSVNGAIFHVFTYDSNDNRLTFTSSNGTVNYSYDDQDRLLSAGSTTYSYGANGELKTKMIPGVGTTTYTYDALGNLVTVVLSSGTRVDYVIDGQNRRVGRKVNGVLVQEWLYQNQLNPVAELDGTGSVVSRFVYGSRGNVPDYMERNGVTYRIVSDHLGSVRLVVDTATGTVAQRIDYDESGNETSNTSIGFQPFGFAGGLTDGLTGLLRFGARDYDPLTGRWTAKDVVGFAGNGLNLYAYGAGDPVSNIDPMGTCPTPERPTFLQCLANSGSELAGLLGLGGVITRLGGLFDVARGSEMIDLTSKLGEALRDLPPLPEAQLAAEEGAVLVEEGAAAAAAGELLIAAATGYALGAGVRCLVDPTSYGP